MLCRETDMMQQTLGWRHASHVLAAVVLMGLPTGMARALPAQMSAAPIAPALGTGILPQAQVDRLLPATVYFQGQSAPLQLRNATAYRAPDGGIFWLSLVDTSGYSTGVRERYQFYLVTERALTLGTANLAAGAYGGGFLSDGTALLMDLGGHDVAKTAVTNDAGFKRPRPLQLVQVGASLRLYLGRQYVAVALH